MNDLVISVNNKAVCTSLQVAEKFGKRHDVVLRNIEDIISGINSETAKLWFHKTTYKASGNNKRYPMYEMTRDGFSMVAMGFTGKKAFEWKVKYINAFNTMENMLLEKQTQEWIEQRHQSKLTRKAETAVLKQLVEYAKDQGSSHSDMLYVTYSKLANRMCGISDRDNASLQQLNELSFIENIILNQVLVGMQHDQHYKEIYVACKRQIELFRDVAYLGKIGGSK